MIHRMKRFLETAVLLYAGVCAVLAETRDYSTYYTNLPVELKQAQPPQIPDRRVVLTDFGAIGDGMTLATEAFGAAIRSLVSQGGGHLIVPEGIYLTGPIRLESNIDLHLERNAVIYLSPDKRLFLNPENPSGRCLSGISADGCSDIAITGRGVIDGNGTGWHYAKRVKMSDTEWNALLERGGHVTGDGKLWYAWNLRDGSPNVADTPQRQERMRADLIRLTDCERVLLEGVTVQNSPRFHVHPFYCSDLIIDGITVTCPWNVQNGDGIDVTDCHRVLIVGTTVDVGDDGLCMKSDPPQPGRISGNEDFLIEGNTVRHAHGGFVMGSNTSSGMRRFVVRHNTFTRTDTGLRFKSGIGRGGRTEQIYISDIMMADIAHEAVIFQCDYEDKAPGETVDRFNEQDYLARFTSGQLKWTPDFQDIRISRIVCRGARTAIKAAGLPGLNCVHDISICRSVFLYNKEGAVIDEPTAKITLSDVDIRPIAGQ